MMNVSMMLVIFISIVLLSNYNVSSQDNIGKTNNDTFNCFNKQSESNFETIINECSSNFLNCGDDCIVNLDFFNKCADNCNLNWQNSSYDFNWVCYENCINQVDEPRFRALAVCIFDVCKPSLNRTAGFYVAIIFIILVILALLAVLFIKYKNLKRDVKLTQRDIVVESFNCNKSIDTN